MAESVPYRYGPDYSYVEIPLLRAFNGEEKVDKASRNQMLMLEAACSVKPLNHYKCLISVNPLLLEYTSASALRLIDADGTRTQVVIPAAFRRDLELNKLDWLVRLYLMS